MRKTKKELYLIILISALILIGCDNKPNENIKEFVNEILDSEKDITKPGNYILIKNLTFEKTISINSDNVILDCQGNSIISDDFGTIIYVNGSNVKIQNCNMRFKAGGPYCITQTSYGQGILENLTYKNNYFYNCQINIFSSSNVLFKENELVGKGLSGIVGGRPVFYGIRLNKVDNSTFKNNFITLTGGGIRMLDSSDNTFYNNTLTDLIEGINLVRSYRNYFEKNNIRNMGVLPAFIISDYGQLSENQKSIFKNNNIDCRYFNHENENIIFISWINIFSIFFKLFLTVY